MSSSQAPVASRHESSDDREADITNVSYHVDWGRCADNPQGIHKGFQEICDYASKFQDVKALNELVGHMQSLLIKKPHLQGPFPADQFDEQLKYIQQQVQQNAVNSLEENVKSLVTATDTCKSTLDRIISITSSLYTPDPAPTSTSTLSKKRKRSAKGTPTGEKRGRKAKHQSEVDNAGKSSKADETVQSINHEAGKSSKADTAGKSKADEAAETSKTDKTVKFSKIEHVKSSEANGNVKSPGSGGAVEHSSGGGIMNGEGSS